MTVTSALTAQAVGLLDDVMEIIHRAAEVIDPDGVVEKRSFLSKSLEDIKQELIRGRPFSPRDICAILDAAKALGGAQAGLDDRKMLLEKTIVFMSRSPSDSIVAANLHKIVIGVLYHDLPHPPHSFMALPSKARAITDGKTDGGSPTDYPYANGNASNCDKPKGYAHGPYPSPYSFRSADGSGYSLELPLMGKAGTPYARTVLPMSPTSAQALPDAGLVFDTLLKRQPNNPGSLLPSTDADGFARHPGGVSSLFFAFADLIIHTLFDTDPRDDSINRVSSYVDLSPLYGSGRPLGLGYKPANDHSGPTENDALRRFDGTGRLWEDVFADARLLFMPPSVCALTVLFCRYHNYVAEKLLEINEWGSYADPKDLDNDHGRLKDQDDELYNRARLVICGFFTQVILGDYVGAILGLSRDGLSWRFEPCQASREINHEISERGTGNACSMEFNLVYRWHAALSKEDTQWTEDLFEEKFKTKDFSSITPKDFITTVTKLFLPKKDVKHWTFHSVNGKYLERDPETGRFRDEDLAAIIVKATEAPASTFKARGIPEVLRVVEILGIEQGRRWGTASLNEFRKFMSLKPYGSFKEWNPDPLVHKAAEELYTHIDNLELHVGLQAEEAKTPQPGVGFCPGYTISRAILADAVALVRGDKFLTTEMTVQNFTKWGLQECQMQLDDGSKGGLLSRLLYRTLPRHFPQNSVFARFPLMIPSDMKKHLSQLPDCQVHRYSFSKPVFSPVVPIRTYDDVLNVLKQQERFENIYDKRLQVLTGIKKTNIAAVNGVLNQLNDHGHYSTQFARITEKLLNEKSRVIPNLAGTKRVDIVRDVINMVPVYFMSTELLGLPLKTDETPRGIMRDQEVYEMIADLGNFVFMNNDDYNYWALQDKASKTMKTLVDIVETHLTGVWGKGVISLFSEPFAKLSDSLVNWYTGKSNFNEEFLRAAASALKGSGTRHIAYTIVSTIASACALHSKAVAIAVNYFLDKEHTQARAALEKLIDEGRGNDSRIYDLVLEVLHLNPPMPVMTREARSNILLPDGRKVKEGEEVACSIMGANGSDQNASPKDLDQFAIGILGMEDVGLVNTSFLKATLPKVLQVIFKKNCLTSAPGERGKLASVHVTELDCPSVVYSDLQSRLSPWPPSLSVTFDA